MNRTYLQEAFHAMQLLEEEDFRLDDAGIKDILDFKDHDELNDIIDVVDPEAESEEEVKDSYVGDVILMCEVCKSPIFKAPEDVVIEEGSDLANIEDECPICHSQDGFKIIGSICPYQEDPEFKIEVEDKPVEDEIDDEVESEDDTEDVEESLQNKGFQKLTEGRKGDLVFDLYSEVYNELDGTSTGSTYKREDGTKNQYKLDAPENARYTPEELGTLSGPDQEFYCKNGEEAITVTVDSPERLDWAKEVAKQFEDKGVKYIDSLRKNKGIILIPMNESLNEAEEEPEEESEDKLEEIEAKIEEVAEQVEAIAELIVPDNEPEISFDDEDSAEEEIAEEESTEEVKESLSEAYLNNIKQANNAVKEALSEKFSDDTSGGTVDYNSNEYQVTDLAIFDCENGNEIYDLGDIADRLINDSQINVDSETDDAELYDLCQLYVDTVNNWHEDTDPDAVFESVTPVREGFEKIDLEMEDKIIHVSEEEKEPIPDAEMITPVSDELEAELMAPADEEAMSEEEAPVEEVPMGDEAEIGDEVALEGSEDLLAEPAEDDFGSLEEPSEDEAVIDDEDTYEESLETGNNMQINEEINFDVDDFEDTAFNKLSESYLKTVYENVESFTTTNVKSTDTTLTVEGLIKFNSGKEKATQFIFEAKDATKDGKVRFIGENAQITRGKKAFTLAGSMNSTKFIAESLNYNYRAQNNRIYGTVKVDKEAK